jgi:hypothetical protein
MTTPTRPTIHKGCGDLLIRRSPDRNVKMRCRSLGACGGFGCLFFSLVLQPQHQELMFDLSGRRDFHFASESQGAHHWDTAVAVSITKPRKTGTRTGGTNHGRI